MAVNWGPTSGSGNQQGCLGIEFISSETETTFTVNAKLYYWTRYAVNDSSNGFYYDWDSYADTNVGKVTINHTNNVNSWSESNITHIGTFTKTFTKTTAPQTVNFSGRFTGIEYGGGSGTHALSFIVPALTTYTITYDANGGVGAPDAQIKVYGQRLILSDVIPVKSGYTFLGWSITGASGEAYYKPGSACYRDENLTLHAVWKRSSDIVIRVNGTYKRGLTYVKVNGQYKRGIAYIKKNGVYQRGI